MQCQVLVCIQTFPLFLDLLYCSVIALSLVKSTDLTSSVKNYLTFSLDQKEVVEQVVGSCIIAHHDVKSSCLEELTKLLSGWPRDLTSSHLWPGLSMDRLGRDGNGTECVNMHCWIGLDLWVG